MDFPTFKGTFDGNKHTINNLKIQKEHNTPDMYYAIGFFSNNYGTIRNLYLKNVNITENSLEKSNKFCAVGSLTGVNKGIIENCLTSRNSND